MNKLIDLEREIKEKAGSDKFDEKKIENRIEGLKKKINELDDQITDLDEETKKKAKELGVEPDTGKVNSVKSSLRTEIEQDKEEIKKKPEVKEEIENKRNEIKNIQNEIEKLENEISKLNDKIEDSDLDAEIDEEKELNDKRDDIVGNLQSLIDDRDKLRDELGINEKLDLEEVEEELEQKKYEVDLYNYSNEIVEKSKDQIMKNVLPRTQDHMAKFLPILTNNRYKDARIDSEKYEIEVFDSKAQEYKTKEIFSGGTRDQLSLALRLAFAMATLPQERGTAPDFIYLDEPLGSFDTERQEALTELITRGEIAENFSQIFVVSHVEGIKDKFEYHIKMEDGKIAQTNLISS